MFDWLQTRPPPLSVGEEMMRLDWKDSVFSVCSFRFFRFIDIFWHIGEAFDWEISLLSFLFVEFFRLIIYAGMMHDRFESRCFKFEFKLVRIFWRFYIKLYTIQNDMWIFLRKSQFSSLRLNNSFVGYFLISSEK